jgi:uncharacterized membrane-anchored protein YjiN (DUF445 family)
MDDKILEKFLEIIKLRYEISNKTFSKEIKDKIKIEIGTYLEKFYGGLNQIDIMNNFTSNNDVNDFIDDFLEFENMKENNCFNSNNLGELQYIFRNLGKQISGPKKIKVSVLDKSINSSTDNIKVKKLSEFDKKLLEKVIINDYVNKIEFDKKKGKYLNKIIKHPKIQ